MSLPQSDISGQRDLTKEIKWKKEGIYWSPTIKGILNKEQIDRSVIENE